MDRNRRKTAPRRARLFAYALVAAALIAAGDLTSKWVMATMVLESPAVIPVLPFFNLVLVFNRGISFGLLGALGPWGPLLLSGLAMGIMGLLLIWLRRTESPNEAMCIAMILGGAAGNLIDRFDDGAVTDFLDLYVGSYHWPAFNVADIFITAGTACLIIFSFWPGKNVTRKKSRINE